MKLDYTNYQLVCKDIHVEKEYVGCTSNLHGRMYKHKSDCFNPKLRSYKIPLYQYVRANSGWNNWDDVVLEECESINKQEARTIEREWIENTPNNLNTVKRPITSIEKRSVYRKEFYNNKYKSTEH